MIRVLIVDDSPVARTVLKKMVDDSPGMEVVGSAVNGIEALELIPRLKPHVVCTDLHMPKMDGLHLTRAIMHRHPLPILVISVSVHQESNDQNIFELLEAGAIDVFPKPRGGLETAAQSMTLELASKIKVLSGVVPIRRHQVVRHTTHTETLPSIPLLLPNVRYGMVAIGASTGGPQALLTLLSALPARFPVPVLCVQHISHGFLDEMVSWLNSHVSLKVQVAKAGEKPLPGGVYFPQEDTHLTLRGDGCFAMDPGSDKDSHRPGVDHTFKSVAHVYKQNSIAVLLTGMGRDGADGMLDISKAGGMTIAQDEDSCVVFGMPQQAIALGAVRKVLPVSDMASILCHLVGVPFAF